MVRNGVKAVLSGVLLATTAVGASAAPAPAPVVEDARQVTNDANPTRNFANPAIAVDPKNPTTVVVGAADVRGGGCGIRASLDGGLSWETTAANLLPAPLKSCNQTDFGNSLSVRFASDGRLYMGFAGSPPDAPATGPTPALIATSADLGQTAQTYTVAPSNPVPYTAADGSQQNAVVQHRLEGMAVDPHNPKKVYRSWRETVRGPTPAPPPRSFIAVSNDGGKTWGDPIDVMNSYTAEKVVGSDVPAMAVGPDGTVYGFTKERPAGGPPAPNPPPSRLFMFRSSDGGTTWSTSVINPGAPYLIEPTAAVDAKSGNLYIVWDGRGATQADPSEAYFMASTDHGATWTKPLRLPDDDITKRYDHYWPGVSVAPSGRIDVAWADFRNDPAFPAEGVNAADTGTKERYWDIYYAYSTDGGSTWSKNLRVTDRSIDARVGVTFNNGAGRSIEGPTAIASTNDAALIAWPDSRAGAGTDAEDVYFTRVRFSSVTPPAAKAAPSKVSWALIGAAVAIAIGTVVLLALSGFRRRSQRIAAGSPPASSS